MIYSEGSSTSLWITSNLIKGALTLGHLAVAVGRRNCGLAMVGSCTYVITS